MSEATERIGQLWSALSQLRDATDDHRLDRAAAGADRADRRSDRPARPHRSRADFGRFRARQRHRPPDPRQRGRWPSFCCCCRGRPIRCNSLSTVCAATPTGLSACSIGRRPRSTRRRVAEGQKQFDDIQRSLRGRLEFLHGRPLRRPGPGRPDQHGGEIGAGAGIGRWRHFRAPQIRRSKSRRPPPRPAGRRSTNRRPICRRWFRRWSRAPRSEAAETTAVTKTALDNTRFWLIGISLLSLVVAIFIVWFFVLRYVIARLRQVTRCDAGGRERTARRAAAAVRVGRTRRHEPRARRVPRQCARNPQGARGGRRGAPSGGGRLAHQVGLPRQYEP